MSKICSLRGISAPQLTPFREDGSINYGEYTRLTQFITDAGVHGVFVCGTTGEFVNLTLAPDGGGGGSGAGELYSVQHHGHESGGHEGAV